MFFKYVVLMLLKGCSRVFLSSWCAALFFFVDRQLEYEESNIKVEHTVKEETSQTIKKKDQISP